MTWETRDLPVLRAIIEASDEGTWQIGVDEIMSRTCFDGETVQRALMALAGEQPPFFTYTDGSTMVGSFIVGVSNPTGHARRTVGTWPTAETWADRLIKALNEAADAEPDPERKGKLRRAAEAVGSLGGQVLGGVITAYVTHTTGLG